MTPGSPKKLARLFFAAAMLLSSVSIIFAERLPIKIYTTADGLGHNRLQRIVLDSRGFLWFCTASGLNRFDGARFTSFNMEDGLPFPSLNDLLENRDGSFWIASNGAGLIRFQPGTELRPATPEAAKARFVSYSVSEEPATNRVNLLFRDGSGQLWIGTDGGLFVMKEEAGGVSFQRIPLRITGHSELQTQIWAMVEDDEGGLWIGTRYGVVWRLKDGKTVNYPIQPSPGSDHVLTLLMDGEKKLWLGHERAGLLIFNPDRAKDANCAFQNDHCLNNSLAKAASAPDSRQSAEVSLGEARRIGINGAAKGFRVAALRQTANRIWIGGLNAGLAVFEQGQFKLYGNDRRFAQININTLAEDRGGNLWIGTNIGGAWKLAKNGFTTWDASDGLSQYVNSAFQTKAGEICVTGDGYAISRFDGNHFVSVRPNLPASVENRGWRTYRGFIEDNNGEWWIATDLGLFRFPRVRRIEELAKVRPLMTYSTRNGLATDNVGGLFEDSHGDIWIGSFGVSNPVITRWKRQTNTFDHFGEAEGLRLADTVVGFCEDKAGNVWMRFFSGNIARYSDGRFLVIEGPDGKPFNDVGGMFPDSEGRLWISALSGRLGRIDQPAAPKPVFSLWYEQDKLTRSALHSLVGDESGHLYIATRRLTLARFDPATARVKQFTDADGFAPVEIRQIFRDQLGTLWLSTLTGLIRYIPSPNPQPEPPPVLIGQLRLGSTEFQVPGLGALTLKAPELSADQNQLGISFFGVSFASGEVLRYQYKLESAERDWSVPAETTSVNYATLVPGNYRFLVRAISVDGALSETPASLEFTILPPFWRRWWFLTLLVLLTAGAGYLLYRYRVNQLLEIERVRMRIATDLHDDIGSGLSRIAILSEVIRQRIGTGDLRIGQQIASINGASQELVDAMSDIVWAINPKKEHLTDLAHRCRRFASDMLSARNIELRFRAPGEEHDFRLGTELRREVYLIFKECINNLARHSHASLAEIELDADRRWLALTIKDNGRGFDPSAMHSRSSDADGDGNGISSIRMRAKRLGGTLEIVSEFGQGTVISLRVPMNQRHWLEKAETENPRLRHRHKSDSNSR